MPRPEEDLQIDSGARMDTYNDDESDYGDELDGAGRRGFGELAEGDRLSVNLDDIEDDDDNDAIDLSNPSKNNGAANQAQAEMEETKEEQNTSGSEGSDQNKSTGDSSGGGSTGNLFAVGESQDKGLADMETGSEVYMSELLVSDYFIT